MNLWRLAIILGSAMAALAVGVGAQAQTDHTDLMALLANAWIALT